MDGCVWLTLPFYVIEEGLVESPFGFVIKPNISRKNIYLVGHQKIRNK